MTTSQLSMEYLFEGESLSPLEDFHARTSAKPIMALKGWREPDQDSGFKCFELLSRSNPLSSLLKTCLLSCEWGSTFVSLAWSPQVTPHGRLVFQLRVSGHGTEDNESSSLVPTITAWESTRGAGRPNLKYVTTKSGIVRLANKDATTTSFVGIAPTLLARDANGRNNTRDERYGPNGHRANATSWFRTSESDPVYLNPNFAEIFMGFPAGWIDLER